MHLNLSFAAAIALVSAVLTVSALPLDVSDEVYLIMY